MNSIIKGGGVNGYSIIQKRFPNVTAMNMLTLITVIQNVGFKQLNFKWVVNISIIIDY